MARAASCSECQGRRGVPMSGVFIGAAMPGMTTTW
jgi:hypothetical protein